MTGKCSCYWRERHWQTVAKVGRQVSEWFDHNNKMRKIYECKGKSNEAFKLPKLNQLKMFRTTAFCPIGMQAFHWFCDYWRAIHWRFFCFNFRATSLLGRDCQGQQIMRRQLGRTKLPHLVQGSSIKFRIKLGLTPSSSIV